MFKRLCRLAFFCSFVSIGFNSFAQQPPDPPQNVLASQGTHTDKVLVTWSSARFALTYDIWRSLTTNRSDAFLIATNVGGATQYADKAWPSERDYFYWVTARNFTGRSENIEGARGFRGRPKQGEAYWSHSFDWSPSQLFITSAGSVFYSHSIYGPGADGSRTTIGLIAKDGSSAWTQDGTNVIAVGISPDETVLYAVFYDVGSSQIIAFGLNGTVQWTRTFTNRVVNRQPTGGAYGRTHWILETIGTEDRTFLILDQQGQTHRTVPLPSGISRISFSRGESTYFATRNGLLMVNDDGAKELKSPVLELPLCQSPEGVTYWGYDGCLTAVGPDGVILWKVIIPNLTTAAWTTSGDIICFTANGIDQVRSDGTLISRAWEGYSFKQVVPCNDGTFISSLFKHSESASTIGLYSISASLSIDLIAKLPVAEFRIASDGTIFALQGNTPVLHALRSDKLPQPFGDSLAFQRRGMRTFVRPFSLESIKSDQGVKLRSRLTSGTTFMIQKSSGLSKWEDAFKSTVINDIFETNITSGSAQQFYRLDLP